MNKELNSKLDEIIKYIKESIEFKNYLKLKNILDKRDDLKLKIEEIKKYQKQIIKNPNLKKELEIKIKENFNYLENDLIYLEYLEAIKEINNMLAIFENKINKYFNDLFS